MKKITDFFAAGTKKTDDAFSLKRHGRSNAAAAASCKMPGTPETVSSIEDEDERPAVWKNESSPTLLAVETKDKTSFAKKSTQTTATNARGLLFLPSIQLERKWKRYDKGVGVASWKRGSFFVCH